MSRIIFVPYLDLTNSPYLSCSNDMRIPNHLSNYKNLVFEDNAVVTTYVIKPDDSNERNLIFAYLRNHNAVVREYIKPSEFSYILEVLTEGTPKALNGLNDYLKSHNIQFKISEY